MAAPRFVHLRLHTEYSIVDGMARVDDAVAAAAADAMPALAVTDAGNLFGAIKFYEAARAAGVQPIIGCDLWITNERNRDAAWRAPLLCRDHAGYLALCELLSRAHAENHWRGRAEVRREWLRGAQGLIALSGAAAGEVGSALASGNRAAAIEAARAWAGDFPGAFYIEVQRIDPPADAAVVRASASLASELGLPVVATHPIQFVRPEDFRAHEARVCIAQGYVLGDNRRPREFRPSQYFKTQEEMARLFADMPQALENSVEIARRCAFEFTLGKSRLPDFPTPAGESIEDYLRTQARAGLDRRLAALYPDAAVRAAREADYRARLEFEAKTIIQMGFAGYFLIVADFINWAKTHGVPVGPGRGSGAGSLVAYSLGITDLDPIRYALLFERFLNPERVSMPDFDIDFCQDGRDRVIDYVKEKYGAQSVSQIVTFGTMAAKAVVRDVGRVLSMPYGEVDRIAKLIPFELGITLEKALLAEPQLPALMKEQEEVAELMALARALEGLARNVGMHAGGVLIAPGKLTDFTPLYSAEGSGAMVSQFDKDDVEKAGLVKFDFLGLTTLTILDWAVRYVHRLGDTGFRLEDIPARRQADLRPAREGSGDRGVPARIARHEGPAEAPEARPLRGGDRPGGALPPGSHGPHPRLHREEARAPARAVSRPAPGADPGTDVRDHGLPGAGDADRAGAGRIFARRRRPAAPRDGQEEARGDGQAPVDLQGGRGEERPHRRQGRRDLRLDGEVRRLRLQPLARGRLRGARLPDRVHEGAPPRGVHGGEPLARHGRHRQGAGLPRRRGRPRPGDPAA
jgi:DNA polymerase-3 subunit alpha